VRRPPPFQSSAGWQWQNPDLPGSCPWQTPGCPSAEFFRLDIEELIGIGYVLKRRNFIRKEPGIGNNLLAL
jgi:hypothetical protein